MIYLDEPYLKLEWQARDKLVFAYWSGFFTSQEFRGGLLKGLEAIRENKAVNWLADVTDAKVTTLADQDYLSYEWTPLAIQHGLVRIAYVVPIDVIAQLALNRIVSQTEGLQIHYFSDPRTARAWLVNPNSAMEGKVKKSLKTPIHK